MRRRPRLSAAAAAEPTVTRGQVPPI